jgi:hypothetical protein
LVAVNGQNVGFDYATGDGDRIVGLGVSNFDAYVACTGGYFPTAPQLTSPTLWASTDGNTWRQAGSAPTYDRDQSAMTLFNGRVVIATSKPLLINGRWSYQTTISIGDAP